MKINSNNYKQFTCFVLVLIALSSVCVYFFNTYLQSHNIQMPFYVEAPSISFIYGLLFYFFDRYLWKLNFFKKLNIIIAEDLNGEWTGKAKSSFDEFNNEIDVKLIIKQTATKITIQGKFNQSKSISLNANFEKSEVDDSVALFYFYRNEPNYDAIKTMSTHEGSVKLIYNKEENSLEGYYYSGRDRNNHGTIKVCRQQS